jgi:eukaryotic-like serine/threonine-protein kinase
MASDAVFSPSTIKLGDLFELDLGAYELRRAGQPLKLGRIPMELLLFLVEQRGQLVTREQIVEKIWGKEVFLDTDNSINAAIRKIRQVLEDNPDEPHFIQTVIGRGYRFIASIELPQPQHVIEESKPASPAKAPFAIWAAVGLILIVTLVGLTFGGLRDRLFHRASTFPPAFQERPSVAVLGFKNLSGNEDESWISTALSEMVSADLAAGQKLRLIPGENVARMKSDLNLPAADSYSTDTLKTIRRHLSSDMVVLGSYLAIAENGTEKIRVNLKVQDARTGEIIAVVSEDGTEGDLAQLVSRGGDNVRQLLRINSISTNDAALVRAVLPGNTEAARLYVEGLAKLRSFEPLAARDLLAKAVAADPDHALSHAALSECWATLGYDVKAQAEAKKAFDLSSRLPREDQLSVEARYRIVTHDWPRAIQVYQMLWEFFPDNLDYGLGLAKAQSSGGLGKNAIATVEALERLQPPAGADPRIDLVEAMAADRSGDLHREEKAGARAAEKGRQSGARSMIAGGLLTRGSALSALGDNANAVASLKEAQVIFSSLGDKQGVARVLNNLGIIARHQSNFVEAQSLLEQSLEISRQLGSQLSIRQSLNNLANVVWERGDPERALLLHRQALSLSRELGDKVRESTSLNNIAGLLILQGKLEETRRTYEESLRLSNEIGDREGVGMALGNIADTLTRMGDLAPAKKRAEAALTTDRQVGNKSLEGYALCQLATLLVLQDDLENGRARYRECAILRHELGEKVNEAEGQLALAQIQLDTGNLKVAEDEARRIASVVHRDGPTDDEALSYSLLASALLAQGKATEAQQASAKSIELLPKTLDVATRLQVAIVNAYVAGSSQSTTTKVANASNVLETTRAQAKHLGYSGLEFEARLRLAQLEIQSGKARSGRARMEQLHKDAQAQGFRLVAHKAADALQARSFGTTGKNKKS